MLLAGILAVHPTSAATPFAALERIAGLSGGWDCSTVGTVAIVRLGLARIIAPIQVGHTPDAVVHDPATGSVAVMNRNEGTDAPRHIVITGAGGFIGSRLAARLLADPAFADARLTLADLRLPAVPQDPRVRALAVDICDPAALTAMIDGRADIVYHLASVLGGAAETDYGLSRRVNVDATLNLLELLRDPARPPRVIFASSIAVFGPPLPASIDDATMPLPTMVYGAQKRMAEIVLEQFSARGWIDGLALRLPGIVARPDADARLKSAYLNAMFYAYQSGQDIDLPVSAAGTSWLISVPACEDALLHAAGIPPERLGRVRAFTLPAQRVAMQDLVTALGRRFPHSPTRPRYTPDPVLEAQFASQPPLTTACADSLGFRHDGDIDALVRRAMA